MFFFFAQFTFLHTHTERTLGRNFATNISCLHFVQFVSLHQSICFLSSWYYIIQFFILWIMKYVIYILYLDIYFFYLHIMICPHVSHSQPWRFSRFAMKFHPGSQRLWPEVLAAQLRNPNPYAVANTFAHELAHVIQGGYSDGLQIPLEIGWKNSKNSQTTTWDGKKSWDFNYQHQTSNWWRLLLGLQIP